MHGSAIRHLAVSDHRPILAAGLFESTVQLWSWETRKLLAEFATVLDFGGQRLILSGDAGTCLAGSWNRGIAAYSAHDGKLLWHRKELTKVQRMSMKGRTEVYCGFDKRPLMALEVRSGQNLELIDGASAAFQSRLGSHRLIAFGKKYVVDGNHKIEIRACSFSLWAVAFSEDSICISEPDAGIRCISLASGTELWHHEELESDAIAFNEADGNFYCVALRNPNPKGCSLIRLAENLLHCDRVAVFDQVSKIAFTPNGKIVITSDGEVRETSTGSILVRLDFPQCNYAPE